MLTPLIDAETAGKVAMLRGEAMQRHFATHFSAEQAEFLNGVLKMTSKPGSYPPIVNELRQPLDNPQLR